MLLESEAFFVLNREPTAKGGSLGQGKECSVGSSMKTGARAARRGRADGPRRPGLGQVAASGREGRAS